MGGREHELYTIESTWSLRPRDTCVINLDKETTGAPSLSAKHKETAFLLYRSAVLEKQKFPKGGEGL